jgi:hypothetical protein
MKIERRLAANKQKRLDDMYLRDGPLGDFCPTTARIDWGVGEGLRRETTPLSWPQRLVLLELACFIAEGRACSIDVRTLARRCGFRIAETMAVADAAPAYFVRRGRTVWLTHPRIRRELPPC